MDRSPIYSAIKTYVQENYLRCHMPGHIGGQGMVSELKAAASLDVTEVPGLDDWHLPRQAILEACQLLSQAYNASNSMFLVNGATSGIQALFLSLPVNASVLLPRNAHRSFYGGMVLSGARPVYVPPRMVEELGIAITVMPDAIRRSLEDNAEVEAVFMVSPSYYGTTCDLAAIAEITRRQNKLLYIDEAHGGHFPFHPEYPPAAMGCGADGAVNGLHKTLPVLNQGAVLHGGPRAPWDKIEAAASLITTTSPSYPILASLDLARELMVTEGQKILEQSLLLSRRYKKRINTIKGLNCLNEELLSLPGVTGIDPLKVLISLDGWGLDGYTLADILRSDYNIQVELAEERIILAMMSIFHEAEDWERLYRALKALAGKYPVTTAVKPIELPPWPEVILSPRQAYFAPRRRVTFNECRGNIAGEMVAVYPPGIPCLLPGEKINEEVFAYLQYIKGSNSRLQGPADPQLKYIDIVDS